MASLDTDSDFSNSGSFTPNSSRFPSGNFPSMEYQRRLDNSLDCAICLSRFTSPRLLKCDHTFCTQCLKQIKKPRIPQASLYGYEIECPRCRRITPLSEGGVESLSRNYDLDMVIQAMPPQAPEFVRQLSVPLCSQHGKIFDYYCQTDSVLVCADCFIDEHRQHDVYRTEVVYETEKETFSKDTFEMLEKERSKFNLAIQNVAHAMNILKAKGEKTKESIQEHFQSLRESLEMSENKLVMEAQNIICLKVDKLSEQEKQLKESFKDLDKEYEKCKSLMNDAPTVTFLKDKDKQAANARHTIRQTIGSDLTPVEVSSQSIYWHHPSVTFRDIESKSGVFCDSVPSMYTATGTGLIKAFIGKEAIFRVEARDKYGNKVYIKGVAPQIAISGPDEKENILYTVDQSQPGEFIIGYTPSVVGWHKINISVNGEPIKNFESKVIVFGNKDYLKMSSPIESVVKSKLNFEPPVSTMRGICMLPNGWIIFVDSCCVRVINGYSGQACQTIGTYGNAPGQFISPYGIALTSQKHIFVTDVANHRVQRFVPESDHRYRFVSLFGTQGTGKQNLNSPEGIAVLGEDRVYVADKSNHRILVLKNMKQQSIIGKFGHQPGHFNLPRDVVVGPKFLLVSDTGNKRIQALTFEGKLVTVFSGYNYILFKPNIPSFIAIDSYGFILVMCKDSNVITVLTPRGEGTPVMQFVAKGIKSSFGICVDRLGNIAVTDSANSHILCF